MNSIMIVLPILTLLMFDLGLSLEWNDFLKVLKHPRAVAVGLLGQIVMLPVIAFCLLRFVSLPTTMLIGVMLVACCPGGSSSNVFSKIAKGDVALSVSLTFVSSFVTLVTLPLIMGWVSSYFGRDVVIRLPVANLLIQNVVTMILPVIAGLVLRKAKTDLAIKISAVLSKLAFPLLMLLAFLFFIVHHSVIIENFGRVGMCVSMLLVCCIVLAALLGFLFKLKRPERRTIVIEVGMQNAAQAIAVASSPFVFNDAVIAVPAIIYALVMNVALLIYVFVAKRC
ncbi:MAG: bile acid:sodium symporter family protein [Candidatus Limimorpha sp.]